MLCRTDIAIWEKRKKVLTMDEYIERETAIAWFMPYAHAGESIDADIVISDIKGMKPADVAPVRHGRWIASHDEFCACSICKYPVYVAWNQTNYCPNCGAKMDLEDE